MKNIITFSFLLLFFHQPLLAGDGAGTMPGKVQAFYQFIGMDDLGFFTTDNPEVIESFAAAMNSPGFPQQSVGEFRLTYFIADDRVYVFDFAHKALFELSHPEFELVYDTVENIYIAHSVEMDPADIFIEQLERSGKIPFRLEGTSINSFGLR